MECSIKEGSPSMISDEILAQSPPTLPLAGKKLYSPLVLAAYSLCTIFLVGCILYGINLRARGGNKLGIFTISLGVVALIGITIAEIFDCHLPRLLALNFVSALSVYQLEKSPFEEAMHLGATKARWWPPLLFFSDSS